MKKNNTIETVSVDNLTAETAKLYIATIRQAETLAKKAKAFRAVLVEAVETGKLAELFENNGNEFTVYADSALRNTVTYIPATTPEVIDMDAVKAFYAEQGKKLPKVKKSRAATLRIN